MGIPCIGHRVKHSIRVVGVLLLGRAGGSPALQLPVLGTPAQKVTLVRIIIFSIMEMSGFLFLCKSINHLKAGLYPVLYCVSTPHTLM